MINGAISGTKSTLNWNSVIHISEHVGVAAFWKAQ